MSVFKAHVRTLWPVVRHLVRPQEDAPSEPWRLVVDRVPSLHEDGEHDVALTGKLRHCEGAKTLVVLVHGLGGCTDSNYLLTCAKVAESLGMSSLRVNLRGADRRGDDIFHAGLSSDLAKVVESPELREYDHLVLLGFSLGGHLVLHFGAHYDLTGEPSGRVRAVASVCPPIDLDRSVDGFDLMMGPYRRYILKHLFEMYEQIAARRPVPIPLEEVLQVRSLRDWDRLTVAPRWGFESPEEYYEAASVKSRLPQMPLPTLLVAADHDPMVIADCIRPSLGDVPDHFEIRWVKDGGHVGFAPNLDLGFGEPYGIAGQALQWLRGQAK